jgi:hypothetical protein
MANGVGKSGTDNNPPHKPRLAAEVSRKNRPLPKNSNSRLTDHRSLFSFSSFGLPCAGPIRSREPNIRLLGPAQATEQSSNVFLPLAGLTDHQNPQIVEIHDRAGTAVDVPRRRIDCLLNQIHQVRAIGVGGLFESIVAPEGTASARRPGASESDSNASGQRWGISALLHRHPIVRPPNGGLNHFDKRVEPFNGRPSRGAGLRIDRVWRTNRVWSTNRV